MTDSILSGAAIPARSDQGLGNLGRCAGPDYALCGWRVSSELVLPELSLWEGDDRAPDLRIVIGPVPARIDQPVRVTPVLQVGDGQARFHIEAVASFLIEHGRRITIQPHMPLEAPDIRLFLLGTPFGIVCHQRGLIPLHAASIAVDGGAVSLAGPSGVGKSTLAAAFWRRGFAMLSDDLTPFQLTETGAVALPGLRRIRLWRDSVEGMEWDAQTMERCRDGLEKFSATMVSGLAPAPVPPRALFHLQRTAASAGGPTIRRLRGREATQWLERQVYRAGAAGGTAPATGAGTGGDGARLLRMARLAASIPRHFVLSRPLRYDGLDEMVDMIVETARTA